VTRELTSTLLDPLTGLPPVQALHQPIVDLESGAVVAFEALARGPVDSPLHTPDALFGYAREHGLTAELDRECQAAALRGALRARLPASTPLFVNIEPSVLSTPWPQRLEPLLEQARTRLQVVVEITERDLVADPAGLLAAVRRIRQAGWGVALDDIGADPASLTLLPFLEPDVIKLDLRLVQDHTGPDVAGIVNAVAAQAERTDALILAEGIETDRHRQIARAMGARLGQGWLFGRPAALPRRFPRPSGLRFTRPHTEPPASPFALVQDGGALRTATKELLLPISHHLERHALSTDSRPVLLAAFEDAAHFTPGTVRRYERLAPACSFVAALGAGMPPHPLPGVRGADLPAGDALQGEWVVCVVGPHFGAALIARDRCDTGPDRERRFDYQVTHDRERVLAAARSLFLRIAPAR
jgi:EAL domain-containing protein (putative c-di-GMP-specific phosphodiesterase class I)